MRTAVVYIYTINNCILTIEGDQICTASFLRVSGSSRFRREVFTKARRGFAPWRRLRFRPCGLSTPGLTVHPPDVRSLDPLVLLT